jgi:DNA-binding MarR family transcriptional regulator
MRDLPEERDRHLRKVYQQLKDLFHIENMSGIELFSALSRAAQLSEMLSSQRPDGQDLSLPRWRLMLHLFMVEQFGNSTGITPTELSEFRQVSKNTISALLRGLEEQGYIQRELDPKDLRIFRIHLTEAGRQVIINTAPQRIEGVNQLLSSLSEEEIQQLILLLNKLSRSLADQFCQFQKDPAGH